MNESVEHISDILREWLSDYSFTPELWKHNMWLSLWEEVIPEKKLPMRSWCYTISVLIGRILSEEWVNVDICLSRRHMQIPVFSPLHFLNSFIDEHGQVWYIDFHRGNFCISSQLPPNIRDRVFIERVGAYNWEDSLRDFLKNNNLELLREIQWRYILQKYLPRYYLFAARSQRKAKNRAETFNTREKIILLDESLSP